MRTSGLQLKRGLSGPYLHAAGGSPDRRTRVRRGAVVFTSQLTYTDGRVVSIMYPLAWSLDDDIRVRKMHSRFLRHPCFAAELKREPLSRMAASVDAQAHLVFAK